MWDLRRQQKSKKVLLVSFWRLKETLWDWPKPGRVTQAVILAPTRELVQQIAVEMRNFSKYKKKIYISTVYGGAAISNQIKEIKRNTPHIIVATPGRLIDLIGRKVVDLADINYLILDEADEMLNMGFQEEIDKILEGTNEEKKTWLFSATMPKEIKHIVDTYMEDPIEVKVDQQNITNQNISHKYVLVNRFLPYQDGHAGIGGRVVKGWISSRSHSW